VSGHGCTVMLVYLSTVIAVGEVIARKAEPEVQVLDSPTLMDHKGNRLETTAIELCGQIIKRTEQPQCAVRTVATSPMVFKNNARWHSRKSAFTQVSSLKQRLISLQLRVATLDKGKTEACLRADQLTAECETLQKQLTNANTALTTHRNTNQVGIHMFSFSFCICVEVCSQPVGSE